MESAEQNSLADRFKILRSTLGFGDNMVGFAATLGISQPALSQIETGRSKSISGPVIKLLEVLYNVNNDYLAGKDTVMFKQGKSQGEMHRFETGVIEDSQITYSTTQGAPYYNVDFECGFDLLVNDQTTTPAYRIDFTPFNRPGVMWFNATGDSMSHAINPGDIIAVKEIPEWNTFLLSDEIYGIVTDEFRTIKQIRVPKHNKNSFTLVPLNKNYSEQEIPKTEIRKIFKVLGVFKKL